MLYITINMEGKDIKLFFEDIREKEEYIKEEYKYCLKSRNNYMSCNIDEIKQYKQAYHDMRLYFAVSKGFKGSEQQPQVWRKVQ